MGYMAVAVTNGLQSACDKISGELKQAAAINLSKAAWKHT